jgi:2-methylcitrate dehydratase
MKNLAECLAEYSSSLTYGAIADHASNGSNSSGESVVLEAKKRLLDSLGCALGAAGERPIRAATRLASTQFRGEASTILGTRERTTPDIATLVDGVMIRYFDFNDTYLSKEPGHPSDNISACLAVAEAEGRSGRDLLLSVVLAYEIQCRLCDAASLRSRGWDHVCYGLVSSSLAAGKLMGLSRGELAQAVNIALNSHIAMRQVRAGALSEWKGFSFANAARNAVFSAMLAREGITGPSPVFEGEMGFFHQVSGPFELEIERFGRGGGEGERGRGRKGGMAAGTEEKKKNKKNEFKLNETSIKFFPAEYHSQSAIWAALEIRRELGLKGRRAVVAAEELESIESVLVETHEAGFTILGKDREKWAPDTRETADHSLPYIVAASLLEGEVSLSTFTRRRLHDPRVRALMSKVEVREDAALTRLYPERIANRVTVRLKGGRELTRMIDKPRGHLTNPMTKEEVEAKFRRLAGRFLSERQVERVIDLVWTIDGRRGSGGGGGEISSLLAACAIARRP